MREVKYILPDGSSLIMWKSSMTFGGEPFRIPNVGEFVMIPKGRKFPECRQHDTYTVRSIATKYDTSISEDYSYKVEVVLE